MTKTDEPGMEATRVAFLGRGITPLLLRVLKPGQDIKAFEATVDAIEAKLDEIEAALQRMARSR